MIPRKQRQGGDKPPLQGVGFWVSEEARGHGDKHKAPSHPRLPQATLQGDNDAAASRVLLLPLPPRG